jgi:hypothetical protein
LTAQERSSAAAQEAPADVRAREVEEQMTDGERFSLLINAVVHLIREDERLSDGGARAGGLR